VVDPVIILVGLVGLLQNRQLYHPFGLGLWHAKYFLGADSPRRPSRCPPRTGTASSGGC
jgi:hypothetical protein